MIRAIYQWIIDNNTTPHLLVNAEAENVVVPQEFIQNGKIILNVGPMAVQTLSLGNEEITFSARFNGVSKDVFCPVSAVLAIYAKENGQGMAFNEYDDLNPDPVDPSSKGTPGKIGKNNKPKLRVVK